MLKRNKEAKPNILGAFLPRPNKFGGNFAKTDEGTGTLSEEDVAALKEENSILKLKIEKVKLYSTVNPHV